MGNGVFLRAAAVVLLSFLAGGCLVGRFEDGPRIDAERVKDIRPGVTTKAEIVDWFGPPQNYLSPMVINEILQEMDVSSQPLATYPFANILTYQHNRGQLKSVLLILFNYVNAKVKSDHLVIFLDEDEKVKYYGFRKGTEEF